MVAMELENTADKITAHFCSFCGCKVTKQHSARLKIRLQPKMIIIIFFCLFNSLAVKKNSENCEKCQSLFPKVREIFNFNIIADEMNM